MLQAKDTVWLMFPDKAMAKQLAIRDIPSLVCDAINLEGVTMTLPEVQTILDGITAFLRMARAQFFLDVNKRMGRFMMNGILLSEGYPIINVPAKRQKEFNQLILDFYSLAEMSSMNKFLRSCLNVKIIENFKSTRLKKHPANAPKARAVDA